jgi:hypothetical protein
MVVCGVSIIITAILALHVGRRTAAVGAYIISWPARSKPSLTPSLAYTGRIELRTFLFAYILSLALQIVTTGSVLAQGGTAITVLTAVHAAIVASMFWLLFWNGLVATQVCHLITRFNTRLLKEQFP